MKTILDLTPEEAKDFFLKGTSYCVFDLPPYFKFDELLSELSNELQGKNLSDFCDKKPKDFEGVNYVLVHNKDGKLAWRPFQLIHPAIYVSLVHKITENENWNLIIKRFEKFKSNEKIKCYSLPVESECEQSDKAEQVKKWCENIEQKSIELSLEYEHMFQTDISDCYGSIYTHSIAWAIHGKQESKNDRNSNSIGNIIDRHIQDMSFGQTNGIPQGSSLMDFIAEVVLGYADMLLLEELEQNPFKLMDYKILRYRDDYRIFVNNPIDADRIAKALTSILYSLGLKINSNKSKFSSQVVKDSFKPGKYNWIINHYDKIDLQKQLLIIHSLSNDYPNSGTVHRLLKEFFDNLKECSYKKENFLSLVAILTAISLNCPRTYPIYTAILSVFFADIEKKEKEDIVNKLLKRFEKIPNTGMLQLWLQRITCNIVNFTCEELLCKKAIEKNIEIWNSEWLSKKLKDIIDNANIVDEEEFENRSEIVEKGEVELFCCY
jgi:RNA-directed DNA polymerase